MSIILVVDAHSVYRSGLRDVIETRFEQSRVVEAAAFEHFDADTHFDLILIDFACLTPRCLRALAEVHDIRPTTRVAVMSASNTRSDVLSCLSAGFHGFVPKLESDEELLSAIGDLLSGRIYVPRWLADDVQEDVIPQAMHFDLESLRLTRRQHEILPLLAQGMSNKEIARELSIAEGTCKIHTAALLRALGARNRTEAAFMAAKVVGSKSPAAGRLKNKRYVVNGTNGSSPRHDPFQAALRTGPSFRRPIS